MNRIAPSWDPRTHIDAPEVVGLALVATGFMAPERALTISRTFVAAMQAFPRLEPRKALLDLARDPQFGGVQRAEAFADAMAKTWLTRRVATLKVTAIVKDGVCTATAEMTGPMPDGEYVVEHRDQR